MGINVQQIEQILSFKYLGIDFLYLLLWKVHLFTALATVQSSVGAVFFFISKEGIK